MADEPDNLVLQLLRRIDGKVDRLGEDLHDYMVDSPYGGVRE